MKKNVLAHVIRKYFGGRCPTCNTDWIAAEFIEENKITIELINFCEHLDHLEYQGLDIYFWVMKSERKTKGNKNEKDEKR